MKKFNYAIIAILFTLSLGAFASKPKHIVFDVMNTLVREVPRWMAPNLDKNRIITFKTTDRRDSSKTRDYHFMKLHYAEKMMTKISKQKNVKIYFYSGDQQYLVDEVLKNLKLTDDSGKSFYDLVDDPKTQILYRDDTVDTWDAAKIKAMKGKWYDKSQRWKKDLTKLTSDIDNTIFISPIDNAVLDSQVGALYYLGHPLFYAKSYADAKSELDSKAEVIKTKPWVAKNYPKNKHEWENDFYKNAYIYLVLSEVLQEQNIHNALKIRLGENQNHLTKVGMKKLDGTWKDKQFHFVLSDDNKNVKGCQLLDNRSLKVIANSKLSNCIDDNKTEFDWTFNLEELEVDRCVLRDEYSGAFIENRNISECIKNKNVETYWKGHTQSHCSYYTDNLFYIQSTQKNKCNDIHIILDTRSDQHLKVTYFAGMEDLSLDELLARLSFQSTISLHKYNADSSIMAGILYPRVDHMMYRGMDSAQMDLRKVFRAIFGDMYSVVESKVVTIMKSYLMGKSPPIHDNYSGFSIRNIANDVIKKRGGVITSQKQALRIAIETLDKKMQSRGDVALKNELIDQYSGTFNEWGGAGLYTAPFYDIAKLYGPNVIAFREKKPRGTDKTYFEYKKYNNTNWPRVDSGEYIIPLYIPANEIEGIHFANGYVGYGSNAWKEALYKVEYKGEAFIMVVDASSGCVVKADDGFVYQCDSNFSSVAFPAFPTLKKKAKAKAFIALCSDDTDCELPNGLVGKYGLTGASIDRQVHLQILSVGDIFNKKAKIFFKDRTIPAGEMVVQ